MIVERKEIRDEEEESKAANGRKEAKEKGVRKKTRCDTIFLGQPNDGVLAMEKQKIELNEGEDGDGKMDNMEEREKLEERTSSSSVESANESDSSVDEDDKKRMKEQPEKKETIIKDLQNQLEVIK